MFQEMKEAIAHFQCAAGAYAYLDVRTLNIHVAHLMAVVFQFQERFATSHASKDLGPEFVTFYKNLMLVIHYTWCILCHVTVT